MKSSFELCPKKFHFPFKDLTIFPAERAMTSGQEDDGFREG